MSVTGTTLESWKEAGVAADFRRYGVGAVGRGAEAGARLTGGQGDAASLDSVAGTKAADLVICHNVLEYVDSPTDAMTAIAAVLRPSATVSVLASNTVAAVLHRALAGRFAEA